MTYSQTKVRVPVLNQQANFFIYDLKKWDFIHFNKFQIEIDL